MISFNGRYQLNIGISYSDKSLAHRALILASIASGTSIIHNLTLSQDVLSTIGCLQSLGANIQLCGATATVTPILEQPSGQVTLNCGNSGTTARLLAGVVAGLGTKARFVGDESLTKRPMERVIAPLRAMGAQFDEQPDCLFVSRGGKLTGTTIQAPVDSAQVKSAVLLAGLFADGATRYIERNETRNHTENLLSHLGADIAVDGLAVTVGKSKLNPFEIQLPNDPSSAAFVVALALAKGEEVTLPNVLLNETRLGFYRVLQKSGANITFDNIRDVFGERVGDIVVKKSTLTPFVACKQDVIDGIDEIPILSALALTVCGKHIFRGVAELQYKESNRIEAISRFVCQCNQQAIFDCNDLTIVSDGNLPAGKYFRSLGDHRIAMSEAILSIIVGCGSVDNAPFAISFPQFLPVLGITPLRLGLIGQSVSDSKSPRLMAHLACNDGVCCSYDTVNLPEDICDCELLKVIDSFDGLNVTMPFKNRVARLLNAETPSVNTVGRHIEPTSTDGYGIAQSLASNGIDLTGKSVLIVGAGGAAEACIRQLSKLGCKIGVVNRTQERAQKLISKYGLCADVVDPIGVLSFVPECQFEQNMPLPLSAEFVLIADYKGNSGLRAQALERNLTVIDGLEMLYHQGARSFALWTGTRVQDDYQSFRNESANK